MKKDKRRPVKTLALLLMAALLICGALTACEKKGVLQEGLPDLYEEQDKQKVEDAALAYVQIIAEGEPTAHFLDGFMQTYHEHERSIVTHCHILMDDGAYYVVKVLYPGYTIYGYHLETDEAFPPLEELPDKGFETWRVF
jgi:predicted small lipoprotein YifL